MTIFDDDSIWEWTPPREYADYYRSTEDCVLFGCDPWWSKETLLDRVRWTDTHNFDDWYAARTAFSTRDLIRYVNPDGCYYTPSEVDPDELSHVRNHLRHLIINMYKIGAGAARSLAPLDINSGDTIIDALFDAFRAMKSCTGTASFPIFKKILVRLLDREEIYDAHAALPKPVKSTLSIFSPGWAFWKAKTTQLLAPDPEYKIVIQYLPMRENAGLYLAPDPYWETMDENLRTNYINSSDVPVFRRRPYGSQLRDDDWPLIQLVTSYLNPAGKNYDPWTKKQDKEEVVHHADKLQSLICALVRCGWSKTQVLTGKPIFDVEFMEAWATMQEELARDAGVVTLGAYKEIVLALERKQKEYLLCYQCLEDPEVLGPLYVQIPARWIAFALL